MSVIFYHTRATSGLTDSQPHFRHTEPGSLEESAMYAAKTDVYQFS